MRKIFFAMFICSLFLIRIASSSVIEVGIAEKIKGNISSITYDNNSDISKFSIEFYNTGSIGYKARIKAEIDDGKELIFNGWSQEKAFLPGERKTFDIYWYSNNSGSYFVKLKAYFGNEILEYEKFGLFKMKTMNSEDIFEVKNFRTYDNYIIFDIKSRENVKNIVVIPDNYVSGWIFEQKEITDMPANNSRLVIINYYPTLWANSNVSLTVVSDNGKYYTEKTFEMKKYEGLAGFLYYVLDSIRIALFS